MYLTNASKLYYIFKIFICKHKKCSSTFKSSFDIFNTLSLVYSFNINESYTLESLVFLGKFEEIGPVKMANLELNMIVSQYLF